LKKTQIVLSIIILAMFILVIILVTRDKEESEHAQYPDVCVSQWLQDSISVEETLDCIEKVHEKRTLEKDKSKKYDN